MARGLANASPALVRALAPWRGHITIDFGDDAWIRFTMWRCESINPRSWPVFRRGVVRSLERAGYGVSAVDLGDRLVVYVSGISAIGTSTPIAPLPRLDIRRAA